MNTKTLKALFDDDDELVRKYIIRFTEDMPGLLLLMQKSTAAHQWEQLSIQAHSYKSHMQYINEDGATGTAYEIEKISDGPSPDRQHIVMLICQLEDHLAKLLVTLKELIV